MFQSAIMMMISACRRRRCSHTTHRHFSVGSSKLPPLSSQQQQQQQRNQKQKTGLYSLQGLHQPSDFIQRSKQAMIQCDSLRSHLSSILDSTDVSSSNNNKTPMDILHNLDDISNIVCSVIDAAELCRSTHISPTWRNAANESFRILSDYISQLNSDVSLYQALQLVVKQEDQQLLTEEEWRMASSLKAEFERDGIHLPYEQRQHVRTLTNRVVSLETLFMEHVTKGDCGTRSVTLDAGDVLQVIPPHYLPSPPSPSSFGQTNNNNSSNKIAISTDESNILHTLLRHSSNPNLRKEVYMEYNTSIKPNLDVLHSLIRSRHELSTALGFDCYAQRFLQDKMVKGDSKQVYKFLNGLLKRGEDMYRKEMEMILNVKHQVEGGSGGSSGVVEAWDVPFYTHLIKSHQALQQQQQQQQRRGGISSGAAVDLSNLQFSLNNVVQKGMKTLVDKLFGIQMVEVEMSLYERWDVEHFESTDDASEMATKVGGGGGGGVRKFEFHHEEEGPLGTMYLDLHPRPGKYVHAAHFTIRCGCKPRPSSSSFNKQKEEHQLPIVALVCNLASNNNNNNENINENNNNPENSILSHGEVETLLHEFGHALHSLLSRTSFQHLSGTRAPIDFVETPSHFMEQFAWEPQFLRLVLSSSSDDDDDYLLSSSIHDYDDVISTLISTRYAFRGIDVRTQIVYALFDQALFGTSYPHEKGSGSGIGGVVNQDASMYHSTQLFASLHQQHNVPYAKGTHWHTRFGHLVTYGAGYYGYLYSQVFALDIWKTRFATAAYNGGGGGGVGNGNDGVMSRKEGTRVWKDMLIYGGGKDPNVMLRDVLGREPSVDAFF